MLAVIWMTLLFSVMGGSDTGGTEGIYANGWSITFSKELLTPEAGLCIVIPCSFTHNDKFKPKSATWFKCESGPKCKDADRIFHSKKATGLFTGRVALLKRNITLKNCGITINDLTESDTGLYQFRVETPTDTNPSDGWTFDLQKTLRVTGLTQKPQVNVPPALTEGHQTTLTCTAPGLCSGTPPSITWTCRKTGHNDSLITSNVTIFKTENLTRVSQRHSSNLTFTPTPKHDGSEVTCQVTFKGNITTQETVTLNVTYLKEPRIRGNTTIGEGGTLNLTCDVEKSPPSTVIWTGLDSNKKLMNGTERANLVIPMVTREHSGKYSCTAQHLTKTLTTFTDITVMTFPVILKGSECVLSLRLGTLICVCISQGFPLPTITWPVIENKSVNSFTTTVDNFTVSSTISLTVEHHYNTSVKCFSKGYGTPVNKTLIIKKDEPMQEGQDKDKGFFSIITVKTIIAFLIGAILSMTICCLAKACHRCTEKNSRDQAEMLQMVTCQDQQTGGGQGVDGDEQTPQRENLEGGGEADRDQNSGAPDSSVPQGEVKEEDYANIDYSQLKRRNAEEAERKQETTETEYAEVKREEENKMQDSGAEDSGTLKGEDEEEEAMIGQHEKTEEHCTTEEDEGEDTALYSDVKAIMDEG